MKHDINTVIETGQELFRTRGYFNTGTEEILEKSGYPRSSFYYHFKSKEGFASQVLESYGEASAAYYRDQLLGDSQAKPLERIWTFIEKTIGYAIEGEFKSECLIQKFSIECAGMNENLRSVTQRQMNKMLTVLEECVEEGQHSGEIRQDLDAREIAELIQSQLYGSFILGRLARDGEGMKKNMQRVLDYMKYK
jgi:TetR/AcrR family transcriptional repressor of nem operon